jgi:hypothetical protein
MAERILDKWNKSYEPRQKLLQTDLMLRDAIEKLSDHFVLNPDYGFADKYVLTHLVAEWGNKTLGNIMASDLDAYCDKYLKTLTGSTIRKRFNTLREIYREAKAKKLYVGPSPFTDFSRNLPANSHARRITLEYDEQACLLKACYDPAPIALYRRHKKKGKPQRRYAFCRDKWLHAKRTNFYHVNSPSRRYPTISCKFGLVVRQPSGGDSFELSSDFRSNFLGPRNQ